MKTVRVSRRAFLNSTNLLKVITRDRFDRGEPSCATIQAFSLEAVKRLIIS